MACTEMLDSLVSAACLVTIDEASLTIAGIYYVVGLSPQFHHEAKQRAVRAGRTGLGKCYRLYTEIAYRNELLPSSVLENEWVNLGQTSL